MLTTLPSTGTDWETLRSELIEMKKLDVDWRRGRLPAYIYYYDENLRQVQSEAYALYGVENALGAGKVFKSLTAMLADIGGMAFDLFHAPAGAGMSFTSGGTESLFEAIKTARKFFRIKHPGHSGPLNLVAPMTAHPAVNKAGEILDVDIRRIEVGPEHRADVDAMAAAVDGNTIMIFGSAPCFTFGVFDPIAALGRLALERGLWLHVDGCWGGFISPFAKRLGYPIPDWDLAVPGVTSMSADIHKFGFASKGASLLVFRDEAMKAYERFEYGSSWAKGTYVTPTFLGSRPAGAIASAWAVMRYLGWEGYMATTKATMDATMGFIRGIDAIPGLRCLRPNGESNLFGFVSNDPAVDIMAVADLLDKKGWATGRLHRPLGIQQGVNPVHLPIVGEYLDDVREAVEQVRASGQTGAFKDGTY